VSSTDIVRDVDVDTTPVEWVSVPLDVLEFMFTDKEFVVMQWSYGGFDLVSVGLAIVTVVDAFPIDDVGPG
jgi:hypothetical protein